MEEIYKETIEESERFDGDRYRKLIFEEFTVYNEKVEKNAYIDDKKAYVRYEFNFDGRVREENMYINLFANALGYTGDFEKDIKSETIEYMSDYFPGYDLYLGQHRTIAD